MAKLLFLFFLIASNAHAELNVCPRPLIATAVTNQWINSISAAGVVTQAQPAFSNLSGSWTTSQYNSGTGASSSTYARGDGTWATPTAVVNTAAPTVQRFTSGSGTYNKNYTFIITSGSATVGATYTNNAVTFTVYATVASSTKVVMSGSGAPASSGTLTKSAGTGDATLTFSQVLAPLYLRVRAIGGGGGGAGNATAAQGVIGGNTTFGSSLITANGALGGAGRNADSPAATATIGTGAYGTAISGGQGEGSNATVANAYIQGGQGCTSPFGGAGGGGSGNSAGNPAVANTGSGGGGAGSNGVLSNQGGAGGNCGGYVDAIIAPTVAATYSYAVGAAGTAGTGSNFNGGTGGSGYIEVTEYYQ